MICAHYERHRNPRNPEIKRSKAHGGLIWALKYSSPRSTSELVHFHASRSSGCERGGGAQSKDPNKSRASWAADMTWHRFAAANAPCCQWPHQVRSRARSSFQAVWARLMRAPSSTEGGGMPRLDTLACCPSSWRSSTRYRSACMCKSEVSSTARAWPRNRSRRARTTP